MTIRWISPLDPQSTEIARYSAQLMPCLQQYVCVSSVEDGAGGSDPDWWTKPPGSAELLRGRAPVPVYHIGNNALHLPIHELACREPGLVVLHDLSLVDLAKHLSHAAGRSESWKDQMFMQYGEELRGLVNRSEKSVSDYNEMTANYPLFQPFVQHALGVVVHSSYARDAVLRELPPGTPVRQLNLPAPPPPPPVPRDYHKAPLNFVFCGHVGPNRRLLEFFEAWGRLDDPSAIALQMFGNIHNRTQLMQYARHFGVARFLEIKGYVAEAELEKALHSAHFAINLRWPTMGEASASQLRYWSAALPTLVTDVGWYSELPDDIVCKISARREIDDIVALLQDALVAPEKYRQIGQQGLDYLTSQHSMQNYAQELTELAARLGDRRLACRALDRELVTIIASMCEDGATTALFRDAIETAVATFEPATEQLKDM